LWRPPAQLVFTYLHFVFRCAGPGASAAGAAGYREVGLAGELPQEARGGDDGQGTRAAAAGETDSRRRDRASDAAAAQGQPAVD